MKLHLPKTLFTALLAACMVQTSWGEEDGAVGWYNENAGGSYSVAGETFSYQAGGIFYTAAGNNGTVDAASQKRDFIYIRHDEKGSVMDSSIDTITLRDDQFLQLERSRWGECNYENLTIENIVGAESFDMMVHGSGSTFVVKSISGTVNNLRNNATLTIGTEESSTNFGTTVYNSGTFAVNGAVSVSNTPLGKYEIADYDSMSYSYGENDGFTTYTNVEFYLIKNVEQGIITGFTEQDGFTINKSGDTITSITFSQSSAASEFFRVAGSIDEATLLADADTKVTASTAYHLVGGTLTVAGDFSTDRLNYESGTLAIGNHTLNIQANAAKASEILLNATGSGIINLAATAQVSNDHSDFSGQLTIASGGTIIVGGKSGENNNINSNTGLISNFSSVMLDGGKILHNAKSDTVNNVEYGLIHSLTVSENGGVFEVYDQNTGSDIHFDGTTILNGKLTINTGWKQNTSFDKLSGSGDITITAATNAGVNDKVNICIKDPNGYQGKITVNNKTSSGGTTLQIGNNVDLSNNKAKNLEVVLNDGARLVIDGHDNNKDTAEGSQYIGKVELGANSTVHLSDGSHYFHKGIYLKEGVSATVENRWDKKQYIAGINGTDSTLVLTRMNDSHQGWNSGYNTFVLTEEGDYSGVLQLVNNENEAKYNHGVTVTSKAAEALANTVVQFGTGSSEYGSVLVFSDTWTNTSGVKHNGSVAGLTGDNGKIHAAELSINTAANTDHTYGGSVSASHISKSGAGKQTFSGSMTGFNGSISALAGELAFTASDALSVSSLNVSNVGTLTVENNAAKGTISTSNATLAGGATVNANLTLNAGATLQMNGVTQGSAVALDGKLTLEKSGDSLITLTGTVLDTLAGLQAPGSGEVVLFTGVDSLVLGGQPYTVGSETLNTGSNVKLSDYFSNDRDIDFGKYYLEFDNSTGNLTAGLIIPEPTTATLSLLALAGLCARRRRK